MTVDNFISALIDQGWQIEIRDRLSFSSNVLQTREDSIPDSYKEFLSKVASCRNSDNNVWFLCEDDFEGKTDSAFVWNDFKLQSLESAKEDTDLIARIQDFWNKHFIILISVKNCYEYLALSLQENEKGAVVHGNEPEYEEIRKVCNSFDELMELMTGKRSNNLPLH